MYRPLSSYKFGEEPQIVYFMMLFVKKDEDLKQFQNDHPNRQEVGAIEVTIAEHFVTDYTQNMDKLSISQLNSRFFRSLRAQKTDQSFALLELLKEKDAPDTDYMELLATYNARDFEKLVELADKFPNENRNYQPVMVLRTEAQARLGNIQGFIDSFKAVDDEVVDTVHFLFLLQ